MSPVIKIIKSFVAPTVPEVAVIGTPLISIGVARSSCQINFSSEKMKARPSLVVVPIDLPSGETATPRQKVT